VARLAARPAGVCAGTPLGGCWLRLRRGAMCATNLLHGTLTTSIRAIQASDLWRGRGIALVACVVLMAACSRPTQPDAATGAQAFLPTDVTFATQLHPPIAGDETHLVFTVREDERLIASAQASAELTVDPPMNSSNQLPIALDGDGGGHWWTTITFPKAGAWSASIRVSRPGAQPVEATFRFDVAPP
jgi:hypothetical protein